MFDDDFRWVILYGGVARGGRGGAYKRVFDAAKEVDSWGDCGGQQSSCAVAAEKLGGREG